MHPINPVSHETILQPMTPPAGNICPAGSAIAPLPGPTVTKSDTGILQE